MADPIQMKATPDDYRELEDARKRMYSEHPPSIPSTPPSSPTQVAGPQSRPATSEDYEELYNSQSPHPATGDIRSDPANTPSPSLSSSTTPPPPPTPSKTWGDTFKGLYDRLGGIRGIGGAAARGAGGIMSATGGPLGALTAGIGEMAGQQIEGSVGGHGEGGYHPTLADTNVPREKTLSDLITGEQPPEVSPLARFFGSNVAAQLHGFHAGVNEGVSNLPRVAVAAGMGAIPMSSVIKAGQPVLSGLRGGTQAAVGGYAGDVAEGKGWTPDPVAAAERFGIGAATAGTFSKFMKGGLSKTPGQMDLPFEGGINPTPPPGPPPPPFDPKPIMDEHRARRLVALGKAGKAKTADIGNPIIDAQNTKFQDQFDSASASTRQARLKELEDQFHTASAGALDRKNAEDAAQKLIDDQSAVDTAREDAGLTRRPLEATSRETYKSGADSATIPWKGKDPDEGGGGGGGLSLEDLLFAKEKAAAERIRGEIGATPPPGSTGPTPPSFTPRSSSESVNNPWQTRGFQAEATLRRQFPESWLDSPASPEMQAEMERQRGLEVPSPSTPDSTPPQSPLQKLLGGGNQPKQLGDAPPLTSPFEKTADQIEMEAENQGGWSQEATPPPTRYEIHQTDEGKLHVVDTHSGEVLHETWDPNDAVAYIKNLPQTPPPLLRGSTSLRDKINNIPYTPTSSPLAQLLGVQTPNAGNIDEKFWGANPPSSSDPMERGGEPPLSGPTPPQPDHISNVASVPLPQEPPSLLQFFKGRGDAAGANYRNIKNAKTLGESTPEEGRALAGKLLRQEGTPGPSSPSSPVEGPQLPTTHGTTHTGNLAAPVDISTPPGPGVDNSNFVPPGINADSSPTPLTINQKQSAGASKGNANRWSKEGRAATAARKAGSVPSSTPTSPVDELQALLDKANASPDKEVPPGTWDALKNALKGEGGTVSPQVLHSILGGGVGAAIGAPIGAESGDPEDSTQNAILGGLGGAALGAGGVYGAQKLAQTQFLKQKLAGIAMGGVGGAGIGAATSDDPSEGALYGGAAGAMLGGIAATGAYGTGAPKGPLTLAQRMEQAQPGYKSPSKVGGAFQNLIDWRNSGLLSGMAQVKKPFADLGGYLSTMAENGLSKDPQARATMVPMAKELLRFPTNAKEYIKGFNNHDIARQTLGEGAVGKLGSERSSTSLGWVTKPFAGAQNATGRAIERAYTTAGYSPESGKAAADAVMMVNQPVSALGKYVLQGQAHPAIRALRPFAKIAGNIVEGGIQRIPGMGYAGEWAGSMRGDPNTAFARSLLGTGAMGYGALGAEYDRANDEAGTPTDPAIKGLRRSAVNRYAIPSVLGEILDETAHGGDAGGAAKALYNTIPGLSSTVQAPGPKQQEGSWLGKFTRDQLNNMLPAFLRPTPDTGSAGR